MKRTLILACAFALVASIALAAPTVNLADFTDDELRGLKGEIDAELVRRQIAAQETTGVIVEGEIKDAYVKLTGARATKEFDGQPAVALTYTWENRGEKDFMFSSCVNVAIFQDGVEIDHAFLADGVNASSTTKKVRPGAVQNVENAFILAGDSPLEIEIKGLFDWSSEPKVLKATIPVP